MPAAQSGPTNRTLEALYNINSHAKKYAGLADENYRKGKKASARSNSVKKNALYSVKTKLLNQYLPFITRIERHVIDGDDFLCLYFEDDDGTVWSYHQPENRVHSDWLPSDTEIVDTGKLDDFQSTEEKEHSDMSLKESLKHLEGLGYCANDYLEEKYVSYGRQSYFVGWKFLNS